MKEFDISKVKLGDIISDRSGRQVRIICLDRLNVMSKPVLGLRKILDLSEECWTYTVDGMAGDVPGRFDLVIPSIKKSGWINIYNEWTSGIYDSESEAKLGENESVKATIFIEWEE
jgi:hypothetical protein